MPVIKSPHEAESAEAKADQHDRTDPQCGAG
jgi:hypothetical protein